MHPSPYNNNYIRRFEQIISTHNDSSNSSNNSLLSKNRKRPRLSPEQREQINSKRRVSSLTDEQRERRNSRRRITYITPEKREQINSKRRVSSLTAEQRERRNSKRRVSSLTPDQREQRNIKRRISSMSNEQRAVAITKRRRTTSTPQQSSSAASSVAALGMQPGGLNHAGQIHLDLQGLQQQHQQQMRLAQVVPQRSSTQPVHRSAQQAAVNSRAAPQHLVQQHPAHQQQAHSQHPQFLTSMHLDPHAGKKNATVAAAAAANNFNSQATMMMAADSNHLGSYGNLFRQAKIPVYTPQDLEIINSITRNSTTIININRRC